MNLRVKPSSPLNDSLDGYGVTYLFLTQCEPTPPGFAVQRIYGVIVLSVVRSRDAK